MKSWTGTSLLLSLGGKVEIGKLRLLSPFCLSLVRSALSLGVEKVSGICQLLISSSATPLVTTTFQLSPRFLQDSLTWPPWRPSTLTASVGFQCSSRNVPVTAGLQPGVASQGSCGSIHRRVWLSQQRGAALGL